MNFKKRVNGSWTDTPHYIHNTSTDTITTPADIYANDTTATVGLKGQMEQTGTPTPSSPIQPQECGDLETTGEHTGQYKIPILNNSQTTNVYLGEVETTRKIRKLVLTGEETWNNVIGSDTQSRVFISLKSTSIGMCTHYVSGNAINPGEFDLASGIYLRFNVSGVATNRAEWIAYLQQQYANGTPVCVWYVLATPTTGIVNEPLRKIGTYADTVSGITIPTIAGANTLSVDTTLQPSEVTVNYKGWHPVADVHERESGAWT